MAFIFLLLPSFVMGSVFGKGKVNQHIKPPSPPAWWHQFTRYSTQIAALTLGAAVRQFSRRSNCGSFLFPVFSSFNLTPSGVVLPSAILNHRLCVTDLSSLQNILLPKERRKKKRTWTTCSFDVAEERNKSPRQTFFVFLPLAAATSRSLYDVMREIQISSLTAALGLAHTHSHVVVVLSCLFVFCLSLRLAGSGKEVEGAGESSRPPPSSHFRPRGLGAAVLFT